MHEVCRNPYFTAGTLDMYRHLHLILFERFTLILHYTAIDSVECKNEDLLLLFIINSPILRNRKGILPVQLEFQCLQISSYTMNT